MDTVLTPEDITSLVPNINPTWAQLYSDAITGALSMLGASSVPAAVLPMVKLMAVTAIKRQASSNPGILTQITGPYQVTYASVASSMFTDFELGQLRRWLGVSASIAAPMSSCPPAQDYDRLFANPFKVAWTAPGQASASMGPYTDQSMQQALDPIVVGLLGSQVVAPDNPSQDITGAEAPASLEVAPSDGGSLDLDSGISQSVMDSL